MTRRPSALLILLAAALGLGACARPMTLLAPSPLSTDRPSFSAGTSVVPVGFPQVETGLTWFHSGGGDVFSLDAALVRAGLTPTAEFRLGLPGYQVATRAGVEADGFTDPSLGVKLSLREGPAGPDQVEPSLALIAATSVPTGGKLGSDRALPFARLIAGWSLAERVSLTANVAWSRVDLGSRTDDSWAAVLGLGFTHSSRVGSFAEVYSTRSAFGDWDDPWVTGGFTYRATRVVQLDLYGGLRTTDPSSGGYYVGFGISRRY